MPTGEPKPRYRAPHTMDTGRISTARRTTRVFLWRRSSSSDGRTPMPARRAVRPANRPVKARDATGDEGAGSSVRTDSGAIGGGSSTARRDDTCERPRPRLRSPPVTERSRREAARRAGVAPGYVDRLIELGILRPDEDEAFSQGDVLTARWVRGLEAAGVPLEGMATAVREGTLSFSYLDASAFDRFADV